MKQISIIYTVFMLLFISLKSNAQEKQKNYFKDNLKHELSFDLLELVLLKKIEISYHYILNPSESIGVRLLIPGSSASLYDDVYYKEKFGLSINYRQYFSNKNNEGFFIEGIAKFTIGEHLKLPGYTYPLIYKTSNSMDLGFAVGYKYVSKNNIFIEAKVDLLRKIYINKPPVKYYAPQLVPSFSLSVGKRF